MGTRCAHGSARSLVVDGTPKDVQRTGLADAKYTRQRIETGARLVVTVADPSERCCYTLSGFYSIRGLAETGWIGFTEEREDHMNIYNDVNYKKYRAEELPVSGRVWNLEHKNGEDRPGTRGGAGRSESRYTASRCARQLGLRIVVSTSSTLLSKCSGGVRLVEPARGGTARRSPRVHLLENRAVGSA